MQSKWNAALCILMSALFVLMSGCLLVQALAYDAPVQSCHGAPEKSGKDQPLNMEQCCKQGLLKAQDRIVPDLDHVDAILPLHPFVMPDRVDAATLEAADFCTVCPPTAVRLAELSLLRI